MYEIIQIKDGSTDVRPLTNASDNGYCKFADGTLIQCGKVRISNIASKTSEYTTVSFSVPFLDVPSIVVSTYNTTRPELFIASAGTTSASAVRIYIYNGHSNTQNLDAAWVAVGRWK